MLRRKFGSTGVPEAKRLRKLEAKNTQLKKCSLRIRSRAASSMVRCERW